MATTTLHLPTAHLLIGFLEDELRPGGAWTYDADPAWSPDGTIVFPERILLRITNPDDPDAGPYQWRVEAWDPSRDTYEPIPGNTGTAASVEAMLATATAFIDEHNAGESVPTTVYPLAEELAARITAGYPRAQWRSYVNDVFAAVLEYPEQTRLAFWDEADFMGSIDGYTWIRETWSPDTQRWEHAEASSDVVSLRQLRRTIADFYTDGEARVAAAGPAPQRPTPRRTTGIDTDELTRRLAERAAQLEDTHDAPAAAAAPTLARPAVGPER